MNIPQKIAQLQADIKILKDSIKDLENMFILEQALVGNKKGKEILESLSKSFDSMIKAGNVSKVKEKADDSENIKAGGGMGKFHNDPITNDPPKFRQEHLGHPYKEESEEDPDVEIDDIFGGKDIDDESVTIDGEKFPLEVEEDEIQD